jgi:hypothetical protein
MPGVPLAESSLWFHPIPLRTYTFVLLYTAPLTQNSTNVYEALDHLDNIFYFI